MNAQTGFAEPDIILQCDTGNISIDDLSREISASWLTKALSQKYPGLVVEHSRIARVVAGCSAKIWVEMDFNDAGARYDLPRTMVVKSGFNRHSEIMMFTYDREMHAYRDLLPDFPINAPKCFYAGESPDGLSAAIIMEDLGLRGVRFCHASQPLNYKEAAAFLDAFAKFHSMSWDKPDLVDGTAPFIAKTDGVRRGLTEYYNSLVTPEAWENWISLPRGQAVPVVLHDRERFLTGLSRMYAFGQTQSKVILMGDEHLGNLYIEKDGTPGFLDFQSAFDPWCQGIAYFISNALDPLDRRKWERDLLAHYFDRLSAYGVDAPSFDAGWDAYCKYLLKPYFVWLTNGSYFQTESVNTANCIRGAAAVLDNDTFGRLGL